MSLARVSSITSSSCERRSNIMAIARRTFIRGWRLSTAFEYRNNMFLKIGKKASSKAKTLQPSSKSSSIQPTVQPTWISPSDAPSSCSGLVSAGGLQDDGISLWNTSGSFSFISRTLRPAISCQMTLNSQGVWRLNTGTPRDKMCGAYLKLTKKSVYPSAFCKPISSAAVWIRGMKKSCCAVLARTVAAI